MRYFIFKENYVHNTAGYGVAFLAGICSHNYFENGTNDFVRAIHGIGIRPCYITRNIIKVDGATVGIFLAENAVCTHNSIWANAGTGIGISFTSAALIMECSNNLIEGFSGAGGVAIDVATAQIRIYGANSEYDNTTGIEVGSTYVIDNGGADNEILSASPFQNATNGNFNPVDTNSVKEGAVPSDFGNGQ